MVGTVEFGVEFDGAAKRLLGPLEVGAILVQHEAQIEPCGA